MDNVLAWEVWQSLKEFDRPLAIGMAVLPLPIPSLAMAELTAAMGGTKEDYEKVKLIERAMLPAIQKLYGKKG